MSEVMCIACRGPTTYRAREVIADVLRNATLHCATEQADWCKRFTDLLARCAYVEGELRSVCNSCILSQLAQAHADSSDPAVIERRRIEPSRVNVDSPFLRPRLQLVHND